MKFIYQGPASITTPCTCELPEWADDEFCDDGNNNAGCNWDSGACCNNEFAGWDDFCTDCECLGPGND